MNNNVEIARERIFTNLKALMEGVEDLVKATVGQAGNGAALLFRDRTRQTLDSAKQTIAEGGKEMLNSSKQRAGAAVSYAQENPVYATAIVAGVAFALVCVLLSRRDK